MPRSRRVALAVAITVAVLASGCGRGDDSPGSFLRMAVRDEIPTLDPALGYDTRSWMFEDAIFQTLLDYDDESRLVGELAAHWEVGPDGLLYHFDLREGARFANGRPVASADVKYSIERVLDPATRSPGAEFYRGIVGAESCRAGRCDVSGIIPRGPGCVEFRLAHVDPLFPHKLAMQFAAVLPREEVERWGEDFARHAVGSGPFMLQLWEPGRRLVLVRNQARDTHGAPRLAGIDVAMGMSEELSWFRYESGELDVTTIPPAEFPRVVRSPRYAPLLRQVTSLTTTYLGMNCEMTPFNDPRVRQAVNYAVNKEKVLRLLNGRGVVAHGFLPPGMPGYQPHLKGYPYDRERARQLLAEAGIARGFATTLWVQQDDESQRLAQGIQQDLREVGIEVMIRPLAWASFLEKVKQPREVPFFRLGWQADYPDPSNFLETLLHTKNWGTNNNTFFSDAEVDRLLDRAADTVNPAERLALLEEVERRAVAAAPWVFLYHPIEYVVVHPRVRDLELHRLRPFRFDRVWLNEPAPHPTLRAPGPPASPSGRSGR
jgi:ABC-type transport system substrate-binding protein